MAKTFNSPATIALRLAKIYDEARKAVLVEHLGNSEGLVDAGGRIDETEAQLAHEIAILVVQMQKDVDLGRDS